MKTNDADHRSNRDEKKSRPSSPAFQRWRASMMLLVTCFLTTLITLNVEGQTTLSFPPPASAPGVAQPAASDPATAPQSNSKTAPEQPASQPPADDSALFVFKKQVQEVVLHAIVVDEQRRLVTTLDRPAFTAFEDGVPQATTAFHRDDIPVALGIVIDNSGSMREKRDKVNQAVLNLIRASN